MNALVHAEKIKQIDQYKRDFNHANTQLAVKALPLRRHSAQPEQLNSFVMAGLQLAHVCTHEHADESPLNILFWLRRRIMLEADKPCRDCVYKASCRKELNKVHKTLQSVCNNYGNVVPLFS